MVNWLELAPNSGQGDTFVLVKATENDDVVMRTTTLVLSGNTKSINIPVYQDVVLITITPEIYTFNSTGGTAEFTVKSKGNWRVLECPEWITLSQTGGTSGTTVITATCELTYNTNPKVGSITAKDYVHGGNNSATTVITQEAFVQVLEISPDDYTFHYTGGTEQFTITVNSPWKITNCPNWLTFSETSGGPGTHVVSATTNLNDTGSARTASLLLSGVTNTKSFSISQDRSPYIIISPTATTGVYAVCSKDINIETNGHWTVTSVPEWVSVSSVSGDRTSTGFTVSFTENTGSTMRTDSITVRLEETGVDYTVILRQLAEPSISYLTFIIDSDSSIRWQKFVRYNHDYSPAIPEFDYPQHSIQYRVNGSEWGWLSANTYNYLHPSEGDVVEFKGNNSGYGLDGPDTFGDSQGSFKIYGNIMSLIYGDNYSSSNTLTEEDTFFKIFGDCPGITDASYLILPSTTLVFACYTNMFYNSTELKSAPELPATTLADYCYANMFEYCSLTTPPELPATTLAEGCYSSMFQYCRSLTTAPELPATSMAEGCYFNMFLDCTSLTTAPELPSTTLAEGCYSGMFYGCTALTTTQSILPATNLYYRCYMGMFQYCWSLTSAPELLATTLAEDCCYNMFSGCTALTSAQYVLPATTLAESCYFRMFTDCKSLTTAPILPALSATSACYEYMFKGCSSLNQITCMLTYWSPLSYATAYWVDGVAASGTFVKAAARTWTTGIHGIPENWTVEEV